MLAYGHKHYGPSFWKEVLADGAAYKGIFYPFSAAMKRRSGMGSKAFYQATLKENQKQWRDNEKGHANRFILPAKQVRTLTNITFPLPATDGHLIYYQSSFDKIGAFFSTNEQDDPIQLVVKGRAVEAYHSLNSDWLMWTEINQDPRWVERKYTDVVRYQVSTGHRKRIIKKQKYFSPHSNKAGNQFVAVHQGESAENSLHVVNVSTGEVDIVFENPGDWVYTFPKWSSNDDQIISAVRNPAGEMALISIDVTSERVDTLRPFRNVMIGAPYVSGQWIIFSATADGAENVFLRSQVTGSEKQLTFESNGAFNPSLRDLTISLSVDTAPTHSRTASQRGLSYARNILEEIPDHPYHIKKYKPSAHLFNVHTWGFDFDDPILSLRAVSTNVLNNVEISAGADYNYDLERFAPFARMTIATLYPQVTVLANTYKRNAVISDTTRFWREVNLTGALSADLNFSSGIYSRSLVPVLGINQTFFSGDLSGTLTSALARMTYIQRRIKARKNLFTKNGQYLQLALTESIDQRQARQIQVRTGVALPGVGINHSLVLHADHKSDLIGGDFQYSSGLSQRGLGVVPGDQIWRFSANYHMPLCYPDWGLAGLIYIYRMRSNLFFDHTRAELEGTIAPRSTVGIELVFDVNLVNELATSFGVRYNYALDGVKTLNTIEFFIPVYRFE
jgi:hypothetical protein